MKEINLTYFKSKNKIYIPLIEHDEIIKEKNKEIEILNGIIECLKRTTEESYEQYKMIYNNIKDEKLLGAMACCEGLLKSLEIIDYINKGDK